MINGAYSRYFPSLYRGVIESNEDPEGLGRCKIRVPSVHGALTYPVDILPWARPIVQTPTHAGRGSVNIPSKGDIVWVMFEGSNKDYPVYLGGVYNKGDLEIDTERVDFYIDEDLMISYDRSKKNYDIVSGDNKFSISKSGIIISGNVKILGDLEIYDDISEGGDTDE